MSWNVFLSKIQLFLRKIYYFGNRRFCNVCNTTSRKFLRYGVSSRLDALCPFCGAVERHRFVWSYLTRKTDLFSDQPKEVLHLAPEPFFECRLKSHLGKGYLTADLLEPDVMMNMDIMDIPFADDYFDVILCSHVLEHVTDDRKAMREFLRVLKPHGWAILMVPILTDKTYEDLSVTDPKERLRLFGQEDHLRIYGPDFADRLSESGFKVTVVSPEDIMDSSEIKRTACGNRTLYFCEVGTAKET